jgi:hypothetical protein
LESGSIIFPKVSVGFQTIFFEKLTLPNPKKAGIMIIGSEMAKLDLEGKSGIDFSPSRQFHPPALP